MQDYEIIALYWARDQRAIPETSECYGGYCAAIARNILYDAEDTEECVNDTWLSAWNTMPPHRPTILSTFLGKITRRLSIDRWRERTAEKCGGEIALALDELMDCVPSENSVEREIEAEELGSFINRFVLQMPLQERRIFICRYWYLDSIKSIAQQFGVSESKVKMILHRQRNRLKLHLAKEGHFDD